jgi:hypothetical protein
MPVRQRVTRRNRLGERSSVGKRVSQIRTIDCRNEFLQFGEYGKRLMDQPLRVFVRLITFLHNGVDNDSLTKGGQLLLHVCSDE